MNSEWLSKLRSAYAAITMTAIALIAAAALPACDSTGAGDATPTATPVPSSYLDIADSALRPVTDLEAEVKTGIDDLVTAFGDSVISGSASGTVISLNRGALELADSAEEAAFTLSLQTVAARCQPFHERLLDALRLFGQEGFEYATGTDIQGLQNPRLELEAIDRGDLARQEALAAFTDATAQRAACGS